MAHYRPAIFESIYEKTGKDRYYKVAEERGDAIPWPLPSESGPFPGNIELPQQPVASSGSNPVARGTDTGPQQRLNSMFPSGIPPGAFGPLPPIFHGGMLNDDYRRIGTLHAYLNSPAQSFHHHGVQNELMSHPISPYLPVSSPPPIVHARFSVPPVGVFWDIENCQVPRGKSALIAVQRIREKFFSRFLEAEFVCVCDIRKESPVVIQELNDAQVSVVHVSGNSKNAADDKLRQAMRRFADVYTTIMPPDSPPATIILISGDINFATDLSDLRYRKRLYVILLHNRQTPEALLLCANEHYDFHALLGDLPNRVVTREDFDEEKDIPLKGGECPMDVIVSQLPLVKNVNKVKLRLKKLSDNCGGKVMTIQGQFAVVRFPNKESAVRATKRMTGEDVFGAKIRVVVSSKVRIPPVEEKVQKEQEPVQEDEHTAAGSVARLPNLTVPFVMKYENLWESAAQDQMSTDESTLKEQVVALLQDVPNHSLPLFKFKEMFECHYGRIVSDYDLYRLRDVVSISESSGYSSSSSDSSSSSSNRIISLCQDLVKVEKVRKSDAVCMEEATTRMPVINISLQTFSARVHFLLRSQHGTVPLSSFLHSYERAYGPVVKAASNEKGVPFEHLLSCIERIEIGMTECGVKQIQAKDDKAAELRCATSQLQAIQMTQLSREFVDLLTTFPRCCLPYSKLIPAYHRRFGRQFRAADYGYPSVWSLVKMFPDTVQIIGEDSTRILTLSHKAQMKRFTTDVLRILKSQQCQEVHLDDFPTAFNQVFSSRKFVPEDYGLCTLVDLVQELVKNTSLVRMGEDSDGNSMLCIPPRQQTWQIMQKTATDFSNKLSLV